MRWQLVSDDDARRMYAAGHGDRTAKRFAHVWSRVFSLGLFPERWVVLEVPGRTSGQLRSFPLGMADVGGRWFLVSMLGECQWVRNVRAADGRAVLRRRSRRPVVLRETTVDERAPILSRYVDKVPGGRPHIPVERGAPMEEFHRIAAEYPVFEVTDSI